MKITLLIIGLLLGLHCTTQAQTRYDDSLALVDFYQQTNGAAWRFPWLLNATLENWHGVSIRNNRVISLDLHNMGLTGVLPDINLTELLYLQLSDNALTGTIPDFSHLQKLLRLTVVNSQIGGSIPDFSGLSMLRTLDLRNTPFTGTIPDFSHLDSLRYLTIERTEVSGSIPTFAGLTKLSDMVLDSNQLTGTVPDFAPHFVKTIRLVGNQLTGAMPKFTDLYHLRVLDLSGNQLTGLPTSLNYMPFFGVLYLGGNALTFEDILPFRRGVSPSLLGSLYYNNQDSLGIEQTITIGLGDTYTIDLVVDDTITGNTYFWYKDSLPIDTTYGVNEYTISNFQASDAGSYTVVVHNNNLSIGPVFKRLFLYSRPVTLKLATSTKKIPTQQLMVYPNPTSDQVYLNTSTIKGEFEGTITNLQGQVLHYFTGQNSAQQVLSLEAYPAGNYIITLIQGQQLWQEKVVKQ